MEIWFGLAAGLPRSALFDPSLEEVVLGGLSPHLERTVVVSGGEGLPPVAADFDAEALRANIRDSQQHHQSWREFTVRAMKGGVKGYFAFLRGQRVTYFGRQGDQHTEWFPGAKP